MNEFDNPDGGFCRQVYLPEGVRNQLEGIAEADELRAGFGADPMDIVTPGMVLSRMDIEIQVEDLAPIGAQGLFTMPQKSLAVTGIGGSVLTISKDARDGQRIAGTLVCGVIAYANMGREDRQMVIPSDIGEFCERLAEDEAFRRGVYGCELLILSPERLDAKLMERKGTLMERALSVAREDALPESMVLTRTQKLVEAWVRSGVTDRYEDIHY